MPTSQTYSSRWLQLASDLATTERKWREAAKYLAPSNLSYSKRPANVHLSAVQEALSDIHKEIVTLRSELKSSGDERQHLLETIHLYLSHLIFSFVDPTAPSVQQAATGTLAARAFQVYSSLAAVKRREPDVSLRETAPAIWLEGCRTLTNLSMQLAVASTGEDCVRKAL